MQLASEEAIEAIKSFILENIEYINSYEKETIEKYEAKPEHKKTFNESVGDMHGSYSKWLMSRQFSGTYIVFFKNSSAIDQSSIGELSQDEPPHYHHHYVTN